MTPIRAASPGNYTTTVYSPEELPRLLDNSTLILPSENRPRGGDELADGPPPADPRLGVVEPDEEVVLDPRDELDRARAKVAELEQQLNPQALVDEDQLAWAAAVAQVELDEREERRIEQERVDEYRRFLVLERVTNRLKAMTESARTGRPVTLYFGDGRAPLPVRGPRWLAVQPPYGTPEEKAWERQRQGLVRNETGKVRQEMEEEDRRAQAAAEMSDAIGSESSDADRDTDINLVSSPAQPADPAWSRSQALFEDAVGDGTYFADPNCEWEEEVEETKHGGS